MKKSPKLLAIRIGALGDVCLFVPVIHELQKYFSVDWLIRDVHANVLRFCPDVKCRLITTSPDGAEAFPFPDALVSQLQGEGYDYCLDFSHWPMVSQLVARLDSIPMRGITRDPQQDALLKVNPSGMDLHASFNRIVEVDSKMHQVEKWLTLIHAVTGVQLQPQWPYPERMRPGGILRIFVQAHASKAEKLWPTRHFAAVLRSVAHARSVHCFVNAKSGRFARELRVRLAFSKCKVSSIPFDPTLQRLHHQLGNVDFALGCDSGPMHFASLLGVPTVVIYGPYTAREFRPLGRTISVSPKKENHAADTIPPTEVLVAVGKMIEELESGRINQPDSCTR